MSKMLKDIDMNKNIILLQNINGFISNNLFLMIKLIFNY